MKGALSTFTLVLINIISIRVSCYNVPMDPDNSFYSVVVLEYSPVEKDEGDVNVNVSTILKNVEEYEIFIARGNETQPNADIIVFPEKGLTGFEPLENSSYSLVPSPEDQVTPCGNDSYSEIMQRLSCSARDHQVYVVVNLPEQKPCEPEGHCPKRGWFQYNTNVVFDRSGTVIARYRKYHLVKDMDVDTDTPPYPEVSIFQTDFGVKFLVLTGSDLLYPDPVLRVIGKEDVWDIVYPTAWFSTLPFLTNVQFLSAWAYANEVNVLASGHSNPPKGCAGAGIFESFEPGSHSFAIFMSEHKTRLSLQTTIHKRENSTATQNPNEINSQNKRQGHGKTNFRKVYRNFEIVPENVNRTDAGLPNNTEEEGLHFRRADLKYFNSTLFELKDPSGVLEANLSTCTFYGKYSSKPQDKVYYYRLVVLDKYNGLEVCCWLFCQGPEVEDCTIRPAKDEKGVAFQEIRITGDFSLDDEKDIIVPNTLLDDALFPTLSFNFIKEKSGSDTRVTMQTKSGEAFLTFGVYGRKFTPVSSGSMRASFSMLAMNVSFLSTVLFKWLYSFV